MFRSNLSVESGLARYRGRQLGSERNNFMRVVPVFQTLLVVLPLTSSLPSFSAPALAANKDQRSASQTPKQSESTDICRVAGDKEDRTNLGTG